MKWSKSKWFPSNVKIEPLPPSDIVLCGDSQAICGDVLCGGSLINSTFAMDSNIVLEEVQSNLNEEFLKLFINK